MPDNTPIYILIENKEALVDFAEQNRDIEWICFDTEFIGEKRFITLMCLIQIQTSVGTYLIDPLKVSDLKPFIQFLEDPKILKIVHAGGNDYRLFNTHFGIIPRNTFDTQIAAAFLGYKYPVAFSKLVESELDIQLSKGYTVTDWSKRPFRKKQLQYALADVKYLYELFEKITAKLQRLQRLEWAYEEFKIMEQPSYYEQDPLKEVFESNLIKSLRKQEQIFLTRLFQWRTEEARKKDYSKEMVLPSKYISSIVRAVHSGLDALKQNRRLPDSLILRHGETFVALYEEEPLPEELKLLELIPRDYNENPRHDIMMEMLDLLVRYKCMEEGISHQLVLHRSSLKRMKNEKDFFDPTLKNGWRRTFLGEEIVSWFKNRRNLSIRFTNGKFELMMK